MFFLFLFLSPGYLRAPSADRRETLPHGRNLGALSPKIRRALPPKKLGAKNMQNLAWFQTTSNFDHEHLQKRSRYPKSENVLIESNSSRVLQKNVGELWSTKYRVLDVSLHPPKLQFSGDYISVLKGCWPLKFLHALEIDQSLLAHTPKGEHQIGLKIQGVRA